jgi:hypothetical protein
MHRTVALLVSSPRASFQEILPGHRPGQTSVRVEDRNAARVRVGHAIDQMPDCLTDMAQHEAGRIQLRHDGLRPVQILAAADPAEDIGPRDHAEDPSVCVHHRITLVAMLVSQEEPDRLVQGPCDGHRVDRPLHHVLHPGEIQRIGLVFSRDVETTASDLLGPTTSAGSVKTTWK